MTVRPVFLPDSQRPWYKMEDAEFPFSPGLAPSQKKKNVEALHAAFQEQHPDLSVLEVSTKSEKEEGIQASPFHLTLHLETLRKAFPVENIYQASKTFEFGGPYVDLLGTSPLEAKRDLRLESSGKLVHYQLEGKEYPIAPALLFYVWLYIRALREHPQLAEKILHYDAFTDIEFNPAAMNCQAKACAIYKSLAEAHLLKKTENFEDFKMLFMDRDVTEIHAQKSSTSPVGSLPAGKRETRTIFKVGDWLDHPGIGRGEVVRKDAGSYTINFRISGPRTVSKAYVESKCRKI